MPEYVTHIPMAGRHGLLLELKDEGTWCQRMRARYRQLKDEGEVMDDTTERYYALNMADGDDLCRCQVHGKAATWSKIMSSLPEDWKTIVESYMGPLTSTGNMDDAYEMEDLTDRVQYESDMNQAIMTQDVSLATGEEYRM